MEITPLHISQFFLEESKESPIKFSLDPMKMNKLVFFAHGWHLGLYKTPLFNEEVQAWKWGTVIPSVYHEFKIFKYDPIPYEYTNQLPKINIDENDKASKIIKIIWDIYKENTGLYLSAITHIEGSPWDQVYNDKKNRKKRNLVIPNRIIRDYYSNIFNKHIPQETQ